MPDQKPNNAPDDGIDADQVGEPAAALQDLVGTEPGGGGLGGASAAEGTPRGSGGNAPNAPIDLALSQEEGKAAIDAVPRAADDVPVPGHPSSR